MFIVKYFATYFYIYIYIHIYIYLYVYISIFVFIYIYICMFPTIYVWSIYLLHFVYFVVNVATYTIHGCYGYVPYQYLCFHPQQSVTSPQVKVSDEELDRYELEAIEHESVQDALLPSLKLTWHLKMDGWNTIVSFWGPAYFQGRTVSFRECTRWDVDGVLDGVSRLLHVRYRFRSIFPIFFEGVYCPRYRLPKKQWRRKTMEKVTNL